MHTRMVLAAIVLLDLSACGGGTGTRRNGPDTSVADQDVGGQAGRPTDSAVATGGSGGNVDSGAFDSSVADASAVATGDLAPDSIDADDTCGAAPGDALPAESSVEDAIAGADPCALLRVTGKVFDDYRQKRGDWPAPALSLFILQDGGDVPGYVASVPRPYIQLFSATDLSPYLGKQVRVLAYRRSIMLTLASQSSPFLYLEVVAISADEDAWQDAGAGPDLSGPSEVSACRPLAYSGGTSSFSGSRYCPVDPSLPECRSQDQGAVVYRDEACALATRTAHPDCSAWQRALGTEVVILTDPFGGCDWPISIDSVFDCGDHVAVEYSVVEPCATCDGISPSSTAIIIASDPKPVRATATLKHPVSCP